MLELKLLKSEVFPATPLPGLAPPHVSSPLCSGSNLTSGKGAPGTPPQPWLWNLEKLRTGEELQRRNGIMNYPVPPGRPRFLLRSGRSWLTGPKASWPWRRRSCRGHQSVRVRAAGRPTALRPPWVSPPGHSSPKHTVWVPPLYSDSVPGPPLRTSAPPSRRLGAGARSRLYLLECLTGPNCSTLTVVIWLLGRQGTKEA